MRKYNVAIVGATGLVGHEFIRILLQRKFPVNMVKLLASDRSAGRKMKFGEQELEVEETAAGSFEGIDIALFSAGADISRHFAPIAVREGATVVDNSSAWRMEPEVPLVVPEVNPEDIGWHKGIIANPNCSTIQMVVALYPLHRANRITRIIVDTYQSVSGTGSAAMDELRTQSRQILEGQETSPHVYPHQIAFNILPEIDVFLGSGYTKEEWKMMEETRKIMHAPEMAITATCARVPVFIGHSEAITAEFAESFSPDEALRILAVAPGIHIQNDNSISLYPTAWAVAGTDAVHVGRIRQEVANPNSLVMWVVADNLRKGAALNTIQIAEEMIKRDWIKPRGDKK